MTKDDFRNSSLVKDAVKMFLLSQNGTPSYTYCALPGVMGFSSTIYNKAQGMDRTLHKYG